MRWEKGLKMHFLNVAAAAQNSEILTLESDGRSLWASQGTQMSGSNPTGAYPFEPQCQTALKAVCVITEQYRVKTRQKAMLDLQVVEDLMNSGLFNCTSI